jgi:hypothetical protein
MRESLDLANHGEELTDVLDQDVGALMRGVVAGGVVRD